MYGHRDFSKRTFDVKLTSTPLAAKGMALLGSWDVEAFDFPALLMVEHDA
jgi:hypothetical protein